MHDRRARPTLRVLREDLGSDWASPEPRRALEEGRLVDLHPLSELPHPIVSKAASSFTASAADDNFVGQISCTTTPRLLEIKQGQWRGGVWEDPETHVCWLVVAGLAKGDHEDRDDFYKQIEREVQSGNSTRWLPTADDVYLLKRETAARIRTEWELSVQAALLSCLQQVHSGGSHSFDVEHPLTEKGQIARVDLVVEPVREPDYDADEITVDIVPGQYASTDLIWQLTLRILNSLSPPEQGWDRDRDTYFNIGQVGAWTARVDELSALVERDELGVSEPGKTSHFAHRKHLAARTIRGEAVRGLCGIYFVPTQDHERLAVCPDCQARYSELP